MVCGVDEQQRQNFYPWKYFLPSTNDVAECDLIVVMKDISKLCEETYINLLETAVYSLPLQNEVDWSDDMASPIELKCANMENVTVKGDFPYPRTGRKEVDVNGEYNEGGAKHKRTFVGSMSEQVG